MTVVDLIARNPDCTIAVNMYNQNGLVSNYCSRLRGKGPYTVFVPVDNAYAKVNPTYVNTLLKDDKRLSNFLKYQAIEGNYSHENLKKRHSTHHFTALNGEKISVSQNNGLVYVGNGKHRALIVSSQQTQNGYIHFTDGVVAPQAEAEVFGAAILGGVIGGVVAGPVGLVAGLAIGAGVGAAAAENNATVNSAQGGFDALGFCENNWMMILLFILIIVLLVLIFYKYRPLNYFEF